MSDKQWTPVPEWHDEQPYRCGICGDTFAGRELGYMPIMCERDGCKGSPGRPDAVRVAPVAASIPTATIREWIESQRHTKNKRYCDDLDALTRFLDAHEGTTDAA